MSRSVLVLFCCAAVLFTAGCGGGTHRLSEAAFRTRANHICTDLSRKESPDLASTSKAGIDRNLARIDSALSQLERLHPPASDEQRYGDLLTRFKRSVTFVKANEERLIEIARKLRADPSDRQTFAQYQRLAGPFIRDVRTAGTDAKALGLPACASGLSGGSSG
jgi:hypothetical protein